MKTPLKVAIVRLSSLGDIIHSASLLPLLLESLKSTYAVTLHWYVDRIFSEILEDSPWIDKLIALPLKEAIASRRFYTLQAIYHTLKQAS